MISFGFLGVICALALVVSLVVSFYSAVSGLWAISLGLFGLGVIGPYALWMAFGDIFKDTAPPTSYDDVVFIALLVLPLSGFGALCGGSAGTALRLKSAKS